MAAPFHMLSNFNECRITGHVFVQEHEDESEQDQHRTAGKEVVERPQDNDDAHSNVTTTRKIVDKQFVFPSAEHYWWAHFTKNISDVSRLAVGGDLSTLEGGLCLLLGPEKGAQKAKHWRKKGNVGIVAKMVAATAAKTNSNTPNTTNRRNKQKKSNNTSSSATTAKIPHHHRPRAKELGMELGLHPLEQYGGQGEMATLLAIWNKIQTEKFTQNSDHRRVLTSTGRETLVEFVRMRPDGHTWGGQVRGGVRRSKGLIVNGGELVGGNFTGECLMAVRASLL